jgi:hypothetical protein
MCSGDRLVADFVAGTGARPGLPAVLEEHLTTTVDGLWVVWAHKVARQEGDRFIPLTGGSGYPADARAECRFRGAHGAPDPGCTCGFHALSSRRLPGLRGRSGLSVLTVALSGPWFVSSGRPGWTGWKKSPVGAAVPTIPTVASLSCPLRHLAIRGRCG